MRGCRRPGPSSALFLGVALALTLPGCPHPRQETPEGTYALFLKAIQDEQDMTAFGYLSQSAQDELRLRAQQLAAATDGGVPADPVKLFFSSPFRAPGANEIKMVKQEGDAAWVKVTSEQRESSVRMVRERGSWRVDVPGLLQMN